MRRQTHFPLQRLNTFHVPATAACYVRLDAVDEVIDYLDRRPDGEEIGLILGGGSNLLIVDDIDGVVLHPLLKGIEVIGRDVDHIRLRVMAGERWDDLVAHTVDRGWGGLENLSLIPGSVGASAVQNIGAYGVEVEDAIEHVEAVAIDSRRRVTLAASDCGFGYRTSHFKGIWHGRYIITAVVFRLCRRPALVLDYPGVRDAVTGSGPLDLAAVRRAIIAIRQAKLPDPDRIGNAGSFFKNPVVDGTVVDHLRRRFPDLPGYSLGDGRVKLPAAWMIDRCGWKGRRIGRAAVHDRHALVLVNHGGATGRDILALAERIKDAVQDTFGIALEREVLVVPAPPEKRG